MNSILRGNTGFLRRLKKKSSDGSIVHLKYRGQTKSSDRSPKIIKGDKEYNSQDIVQQQKKKKEEKKKVFFFHHCEGDIRKVAHVQYVLDKGSKLPKDIYFSELVDRE